MVSETKVKSFVYIFEKIIMSSELDGRIYKYLKVGLEFTTSVTKVVLEIFKDYEDEKERSEQLEMMRETVAKYLKLEHDYNISKAVLNNLAQSTEVPQEGLETRYESNFAHELSKSNLRTEDFRKDARFLEFEGVISGHRPGQGSGCDDIAEDPEEFCDPWTRRVIVEPVRNRKCGHLYDKETVSRHLVRSSNSKRRLHCPVPGCDNDNVSQGDLVSDIISVGQRINKLTGN